MNAHWILQEKETTRFYKKSTWIPLRASKNDETGYITEIGYISEYFGCGSVAFSPEHEEFAEQLDWSSLGISREIIPYAYSDGYYSSVEEYEYNDKQAVGVNLIFDYPQPITGLRKWFINPDLIISLRLVKEDSNWIRPEEDSSVVIKEHFDDSGNHTLIEIKKEFLLDYLAARNLKLRLSYYKQRVENVADFEKSEYKSLISFQENRNDGEFELLIRSLEDVYGGTFAAFKIWRNDVDEEEDAPVMGKETDDNTSSTQVTGYRSGYPGTRVESEFWRNEWIGHNNLSTRIRGDKDPHLPSFIVDSDGKRMQSSSLNYEEIGRWLWFRSNIVNELLTHRDFKLRWYTAKTGDILSSSGYSTHFGINDADLINVYAYDIAKLNGWEQHLWAAHNVIPDGKVADELLASQVRVTPANTYAVEVLLLMGMNQLEANFKKIHNMDLFLHPIDETEFSKNILRFNSIDRASLLRLAKDLIRVFSDRLNVKTLRAISTHAKKHELGSNKLIQDILSQKIGEADAREALKVIAGVYDMRVGDAHPTGSKIDSALELAEIDADLSFLKQGEQLIANFGKSIWLIDSLLFED